MSRLLRRHARHLVAVVALAALAGGCGMVPDGDPPTEPPVGCDGTADTDANNAPVFSLGDTVVSCNNEADGGDLDIDVFQVATSEPTLGFDCTQVEGTGGVMRAEVLRPDDPPTANLFEEVGCGAGVELTISGLDSDGLQPDVYFVTIRHPSTSERVSFQVTDQADPALPCDPVFPTDANNAPTFALGDTVVSCNNDPASLGGLDIDVFQVTTDATSLAFDCTYVDGTGGVMRAEVLTDTPPTAPLFDEIACGDDAEAGPTGLNADGGDPDTYFVIIRHPATSQKLTFTVSAGP